MTINSGVNMLLNCEAFKTVEEVREIESSNNMILQNDADLN